MIFLSHIVNRQSFLRIVLINIFFRFLYDKIAMGMKFFYRRITRVAVPVEIPIIEHVMVTVFIVPENGIGGLTVQNGHKRKSF
ncbi:hypothetical protein D3C76_1493640 [compost metagenome]